ncbi:polycystic kidney disease protein 1-like 3 [Pomacea canaliculata]|uniref:polycystic kidney disease protein 1-like 3 n=1 Tax=Pomacea canaliculata TaxID=400727 RepID=UPI000D72EC00|nr:polycystic kidney disease protein 1-like 3 [Pomacea canaliculata]
MWRIASLFWLIVGLGVNDARRSIGTRWQIWTYTPLKEHAATDARVFIVLYNDNGLQSRPLELDNFHLNDFQEGALDHFVVDDLINFSEVCGIRIFHDNGGLSPGWYLETLKVRMKGGTMRRTRDFGVNRWVGTEPEERGADRIIMRTPECSEGRLP